MGKRKKSDPKTLKRKKQKHTTLFEMNGKVYDIYSGKILKKDQVFNEDTKKLTKLLEQKYG